MNDPILVLNAGSSSLKFALFPTPTSPPSLSGQIDGIASQDASLIINKKTLPLSCPSHAHALHTLLAHLKDHIVSPLLAIGHRVVHGGPSWTKPVILDQHTILSLRKLIPLAPLHMPHHIKAIEACSHAMPHTPQVACFDTAFHHSQPPENNTPALPQEWQHLKRYGFHGLSYHHTVRHLPSLHNDSLPTRILAAHLGNGASLCAIKNGKSIASTMGFSTLDGQIMSSRCGNLDPGVILHLLLTENISPQELQTQLYHKSGLLGLSHGVSSDMRTLSQSPNPHAAFAIQCFLSSLTQNAGGLIALMNGIDALVFTGGIGENSHTIRQGLVQNLNFLGLSLDHSLNKKSQEGKISSPTSSIPIFIINANEEGIIAHLTLECLTSECLTSECLTPECLTLECPKK